MLLKVPGRRFLYHSWKESLGSVLCKSQRKKAVTLSFLPRETVQEDTVMKGKKNKMETYEGMIVAVVT